MMNLVTSGDIKQAGVALECIFEKENYRIFLKDVYHVCIRVALDLHVVHDNFHETREHAQTVCLSASVPSHFETEPRSSNLRHSSQKGLQHMSRAGPKGLGVSKHNEGSCLSFGRVQTWI